jgi:pimeloyl-ACP methyl ester carboxylesterase
MPYIKAADGARIYYRSSGPTRAESLVLIMGLGWDMTGWQLLMPYLGDFRVLRLDNRGTGRSDKPDRPYSIRQMALDVIRCMNATGIDSAHIYGASLGSMIAQEVALNYPARVSSLVLGYPSPGAIAFPGSPGVLRMLLNREELSPEESFMRATPFLYGRALTERPEAIEEVMRRRIASRADPVGMRRQLEAVLCWSSLRRLRGLRVPTMVMHGDKDRLIPLSNGHVYGTDAPEEHLELLLDWLAEQSGRTNWRPAPSREDSRPDRPSVADDGQDEVGRPLGGVEEKVALGKNAIDVGRGLPGTRIAVVAREVAGTDLQP